ncbi:MAG: DUF1648 domain-containing protein [Saprospiraceae bacterium]|nr:DUF1648 domain-containing protein [Saprospiraceae bacterium]MCB9324215.1 DUF1648 domain-containing protein [Lewinellaceae bacterium]
MENSKHDLPLGDQERLIELLSLFLLVGMWIYVALKWSTLPETIPHHFNLQGEPDAWGGKAMIFLLPAIALGTYLLLYFIGKMSPSTYNYPVKITEENKAYQYALAVMMLKITNLWTMILMAYITWAIVEEAGGHKGALNGALLWTIIGSLFVVLAGYIYLAKKAA